MNGSGYQGRKYDFEPITFSLKRHVDLVLGGWACEESALKKEGEEAELYS